MNNFQVFSRLNALEKAVATAEQTEAERDETLEFVESSLDKLVGCASFVVC